MLLKNDFEGNPELRRDSQTASRFSQFLVPSCQLMLCFQIHGEQILWFSFRSFWWRQEGNKVRIIFFQLQLSRHPFVIIPSEAAAAAVFKARPRWKWWPLHDKVRTTYSNVWAVEYKDKKHCGTLLTLRKGSSLQAFRLIPTFILFYLNKQKQDLLSTHSRSFWWKNSLEDNVFFIHSQISDTHFCMILRSSSI